MVNSIKKSLKRAFTITELVIVIAVIAILAAVLIPTFSNVVSSANKSAALSTCRNALTDMEGVYANSGKTNDDLDGMVFVSNDYVYVFLNSSLQYVGTLDELAGVDTTGKTIKATSDNGYTVKYTGKIGDTTYDSATISIAADTTYSTFTWGEAYTLADELAGKTSGGSEEPHTDEYLYIYSIELNTTTYVGFFTYEIGSISGSKTTDQYQTEGATYSRLFSYSTLYSDGEETLTCFVAATSNT